MEKYENRGEIGAGRYGRIYRAWNKETSEIVVVKEINNDGHKYGLREIEVARTLPEMKYALKVLGHEWIRGDSTLCIIYQNRPNMVSLRRHLDLLRQNPTPGEMTLPDIKGCLYFFIAAIQMFQQKGIMHRGLCPENVFISLEPIMIYLSDFRSAKCLGVLGSDLTPPSDIFRSSFAYTAPELLMNAKEYTEAVDMWSLGVILAEMVRGRPLFQSANTASGQLQAMFRVLGLPSFNQRIKIPGLDDFEWGSFLDRGSIPTLADEVPRLGPLGVDLLRQMLDWVPQNRITPTAALNHEFFKDIVWEDE